MKGTGINSIRNRFTILVGALSGLVAILLLAAESRFHVHDMATSYLIAIVGASIALPASVTYLMAGKLTGLIAALRRSTEAIAAGDFNAPVDVNCECDIGGLADSFRAMVARLNSNILRMNILAYSCPVTRLPNRAVINHVLQTALAEGKNSSFTGSVLFIDLDKFKQVNDTLGHDAGDDLLRQASQRILAGGLGRSLETIDTCMTSFGELCSRPPTDTLFVRFAGDEFVALLPGITDRRTVEEVAQRVIDSLQEPFLIGGTEISIGASIGIALTPHDSTDAADFLNFADLAMYAAKQRGRNRYAFFDGTLRETALQRVNLERELRDAIVNREFLLHFQPKLSGRDLSIAGYEALVRWQHPARGLVPPGEFIPVAEKSGQIEELGDLVLELAMAQAAAWHRAGRIQPIAVNVSQLQFGRPDFAERVIGKLEQSGAPAGCIEIELTESAAMMDYSHSLRTLKKLREAGLRVAIDDFGFGFSNLSQLSRLPFDLLKIDRSLIATIGNDRKGENVVKAIISLGHSLDHEVVAEGVESLREFHFLQQQGCDVLQGYLFARPMTASAVAAWEDARVTDSLAGRVRDIEHRLRSA